MAAFTAQLPNVMHQLNGLLSSSATGPAGLNVQSRATVTLGNKRISQKKELQKQNIFFPQKASSGAQVAPANWFQTGYEQWNNFRPTFNKAPQTSRPGESSSGRLPLYLQRLTDPDASADFPPAKHVSVADLDNRELDKLVATLGRNNATWRRALQLHEWLQGLGHTPDDRLCTTLMRVCSQHSHTLEALNLYNWMRTPKKQGGAGLRPSVYTYTGAMRAALVGNLPDRALQVWDDAMKAGCQIDCRMCTILVEVCTRKGLTERAMATYQMMKEAPAGSRMAPTVHAYTAAMRAAAEGGQWQKALEIWADMEAAGCAPSGHAYAAAISACAAGGEWGQAVKMFDNMMLRGIKPDVVSCTALITALAADGQWEHAEKVVNWMLNSGVKPNVRTFTALVTALGNDSQWERALSTLESMKGNGACASSVEPNAYTYSALLKAMGERGEWKLAEDVFNELEAEALGRSPFDARQGETVNGETSVSGSGMLDARELSLARINLGRRSASSVSSRSSSDFGNMCTALAEEVLSSGSPKLGSNLPDVIPGQSNVGTPPAPGSPFSFFSRPASHPAESQAVNIWTTDNAAISGLDSRFTAQEEVATPSTVVESGVMVPVADSATVARNVANRGPLNEVVCGAMMLAYERSGCWQQAVNLLQRARNLGIDPNTIMYNTAISALGKSFRWKAAEELFRMIPCPDTISYETMIAAYGLAGQIEKCERFFGAMLDAGHTPRDYAFCGLIAAYSNDADWRSALEVRHRMKALGCPVSVHVYNALIATLERANQWDQALALQRNMKVDGVSPDSTTHRLLESIGKGGISAIEEQQVATAALTAAVAAAGSIIIRAGFI